jgi:2Fe-2S ferredoxin
MPIIIFIETNGNKIEANAEVGSSIMQVAVNADITGIVAECGGACACGTCHCYIDSNWLEILPKPAEDELDMIEFVIDPNNKSRLSCQVLVSEAMDGLIVNVPETQT